MPSKIIESVETEFNKVDVWQHADGYDFEVAGGTHATWHRGRVMTGYAWDALTAGSALFPGSAPRNLLMLGLGGATACRQLRKIFPDLAITAIEIDAQMIDLARRYMELDSLNIDIRIGDAYEMLGEIDERFDVVLDDVYLGMGSDVLRPEVVADEVLERLASLCTRRGIVVANFVTGSGHEEAHKKARDAFASTFDNVRFVRPPLGFNETLVGGEFLAENSRLRELDPMFSDFTDLRDWRHIRVRRLNNHA